MNNNNIMDQLPLQYHMMRFSHNNKWWWVFWLWGFEVSVVNAYMMYWHWHEGNDFVLEYNHYGFVEASAKAWNYPINYWPNWHCLHLQNIMSNKSPAIKQNEGKRFSPITDKSLCPQLAHFDADKIQL